MFSLDFYAKFYSLLHNYPRIPYWALTPLRKLVRWGANRTLPKYLAKPNSHSCQKRCGVIVSFTSFPARINSVWQVVECMMRQTYQPSKIILWLSKEQFPTKSSIPDSLLEREGELFEIRFVEGDIRSHKKYFYAIKEFPDKFIFLIDDDIFYPTDIIENTWNAHLDNPQAIICNYGFYIKYDNNGRLLPYNKWIRCYRRTEKSFFYGSGGGTLIHSSLLYHDISNIDLAIRLTPIADDIWLNAMANIARTPKVLLPNGQILPINIKNDKRLASQNRENNQNDNQIDSVINYYKEQIGVNPFEREAKQ